MGVKEEEELYRGGLVEMMVMGNLEFKLGVHGQRGFPTVGET